MHCVKRRFCHAHAQVVVAICATLLMTISLSRAAHKPDLEPTDDPASQVEVKPVQLVPEFVSPFDDVKKYEYLNVEGSDWKKVNDNVGEIGGWSVYTRERPESEAMEDAEKVGDPETMKDPETMNDPETMKDQEAMKDQEKKESSDTSDSITTEIGSHK